MDTKLSVDEIELAIRNSGMFNKRQDIFVPNISWGLLNHEADLVVITKSGYLSEIEIKRSWSDFLADFKKGHGHKDERVYKLYYAVPESIAQKVIAFFIENKVANNGLIIYGEDGGCKINYIPETPYFSGGRKLFIEECLTIARLGCMRIFALKSKLVKLRQNESNQD